MRFDDRDLVVREYADEERFAARRAVFLDLVEGENEDLALEALREVGPERVLEVGCGLGAFAERMQRDLDADVVAVDLSHRMVELTAGRGVDRVLRPGGRLVAATFSAEHVRELYDWLGSAQVGDLEFSSENAAEPIERRFASVERSDAKGIVRFPDREVVHRYLRALVRGSELADRLPQFEGEFQARSRQSLFVADKS